MKQGKAYGGIPPTKERASETGLVDMINQLVTELNGKIAFARANKGIINESWIDLWERSVTAIRLLAGRQNDLVHLGKDKLRQLSEQIDAQSREIAKLKYDLSVKTEQVTKLTVRLAENVEQREVEENREILEQILKTVTENNELLKSDRVRQLREKMVTGEASMNARKCLLEDSEVVRRYELAGNKLTEDLIQDSGVSKDALRKTLIKLGKWTGRTK